MGRILEFHMLNIKENNLRKTLVNIVVFWAFTIVFIGVFNIIVQREVTNK